MKTVGNDASVDTEQGNTIILGLGIWLCIVFLLLGFFMLAGLYSERRALLEQADFVALTLVDDIDEDAYYSYGLVRPIDGPELERRAWNLVQPDTHVEAYREANTDVLVVTLRKKSEVIPLYSVIYSGDVELEATSKAIFQKE